MSTFSPHYHEKKKNISKETLTRIDVYETLCPNRCLYIKVAKLRTGVGIAEMSQNIFIKSTGGGDRLGVGGVRMDVNEELKFL